MDVIQETVVFYCAFLCCHECVTTPWFSASSCANLIQLEEYVQDLSTTIQDENMNLIGESFLVSPHISKSPVSVSVTPVSPSSVSSCTTPPTLHRSFSSGCEELIRTRDSAILSWASSLSLLFFVSQTYIVRQCVHSTSQFPLCTPSSSTATQFVFPTHKRTSPSWNARTGCGGQN